MDDLTLVGVHDDGEHVVLTGPGGQQYLLRVDEALRAFLRTEALLPVKLYREPIYREKLRELLSRAPDNEQLQRLAKRADLDQR